MENGHLSHPPSFSMLIREEVVNGFQIGDFVSSGLRNLYLEKACSLGEHTAEPISFYRGKDLKKRGWMYMNPMERGAWQAAVHGVARVRHDLATKPPPQLCSFHRLAGLCSKSFKLGFSST